MRSRSVVVALALAASAVPDARADAPAAELVKQLDSKDWTERAKALKELAALGRSPAAEKAALRVLGDDDWGIQIEATRTLAAVGARPSIDALTKLAIEGEIQWVRDAAADALRAIDADAGAASLLDRARNAGQKGDVTRQRAYRAAGRVGGKDTLTKLASHADARDPDVAAAALRGLAALAPTAPDASAVIKAAEAQLGARDEKKLFQLYAASLEALGACPSPAAAGLLVAELVRQPDDDPYVQERIARGLEKRAADDVAGAVRMGFGQAKRPEEIRRVARLAGRLRCAGVAAELPPLFAHKEDRVRSEAAKALGLCGDAASAASLRPLLEDKSPYVRLEAVTALAWLLPAAEFRALGEKLRKDPVELIRLQYVVELNDRGDPAAIADLVPCLSDGAWRVSTAAAAAIGTLGTAEDQEKLLPLVAHKTWQVRAAAFEGLGRLRAASAIPHLAEGLADRDPLVRGVCHANLQILAREKLAPEAKLWRAWWEKNGPGLVLVKRSRRSAEELEKENKANERYANQRVTRDAGIEILQKSRILVVTGAWDHVERVLGHLKIEHTLLRAQQLKEAGINPNQTILVNCEGNMDEDSRLRVQWFVNVGGYLMTTDWALTKTVEPAFPGYLKQFSGSSTGNDVVVVEDARPGHPFTAGVFEDVPALKWWLEVQAFPMSVIWPERTDVLVDSSEMKRRYGSSPMAAVFRWGLGKVQHSISHFYLQEEGMQQAQKPRDRMVFAADNLGISLDDIRRIAKENGFEGQLNDETMQKIAPDYSMFRMIVNVVLEKSVWVENL